MENIEKVLDRGDRIELLVHKSDTLNDHAIQFNKHSKKLKNRMLWKNIRMTLILFFIIAVVIYLILGWACGFDLSNC
jgi:vesicle-associated membrane protein 7